MVETSDLTEGIEAKLTFMRESAVLGRERQTVTAEVLAVEGQIVTLANPYGYDSPELVIDPDGDVWARGEDGSDGFHGRNAVVEEVA